VGGLQGWLWEVRGAIEDWRNTILSVFDIQLDFGSM